MKGLQAGAFRPGRPPRTEAKGQRKTHMPSPTPTRITQQASDQKLVDGLTKHAGVIASLYVGGASLPNAVLVSKLQALIAAVNSTNTARASLHAAVLAEQQLQASSAQFVSDVRQTILAIFSG